MYNFDDLNKDDDTNTDDDFTVVTPSANSSDDTTVPAIPSDPNQVNSQKDNTTPIASGASTQDTGLTPEMIIKSYEDQILAELGLESLPEKEKEEYRKDIDNLANERIINSILIVFPEDKIEEFQGKIASNISQEELFGYIESVIPNFDAIIGRELLDLKADLITKTKGKTE